MFKTLISGVSSANHVIGSASKTVVGAGEAAMDKLLAPPKGSPAAPSSLAPSWRDQLAAAAKAEAPATVRGGGLALAGAGAGAYIWKRHRVLGALGGAALGSAVDQAIDGNYVGAARGLGVRAAGIGGALVWSRHPILGFLGGTVVGEIAARVLGK